MEQLTGRGTVVLIPPDAGKRQGARPGWDGGLYTFMRRVLATDRGGELYAKRKRHDRADLRRHQVQPPLRPLPTPRPLRRALGMAPDHRDAQLAQAPPPPTRHRSRGSLKRPRGGIRPPGFHRAPVESNGGAVSPPARPASQDGHQLLGPTSSSPRPDLCATATGTSESGVSRRFRYLSPLPRVHAAAAVRRDEQRAGATSVARVRVAVQLQPAAESSRPGARAAPRLEDVVTALRRREPKSRLRGTREWEAGCAVVRADVASLAAWRRSGEARRLMQERRLGRRPSSIACRRTGRSRG